MWLITNPLQQACTPWLQNDYKAKQRFLKFLLHQKKQTGEPRTLLKEGSSHSFSILAFPGFPGLKKGKYHLKSVDPFGSGLGCTLRSLNIFKSSDAISILLLLTLPFTAWKIWKPGKKETWRNWTKNQALKSKTSKVQQRANDLHNVIAIMHCHMFNPTVRKCSKSVKWRIKDAGSRFEREETRWERPSKCWQGYVWTFSTSQRRSMASWAEASQCAHEKNKSYIYIELYI